MPRSAHQNNEKSLPIQQRNNHETRRPRVSFSDYNKVQFIESTNESSQQSRQQRHRKNSHQ